MRASYPEDNKYQGFQAQEAEKEIAKVYPLMA